MDYVGKCTQTNIRSFRDMIKYNSFYETIPKVACDIEFIQAEFKKRLHYASMGRFGIFHILNAVKQNNDFGERVMMPVYACDSIAWAIRKAGYVPIYYDICEEDLNGSLDNIKKVAKNSGSKILLLPSLYGNPANLIEAEKFCIEAGIFLIDDAAQAFGATLGDKMVGSFGDSGLFSFSAGKPTFGHMGCYFWLDLNYYIKRTKHYLYHRLEYFNFFFNRYGDYNSKRLYRIKTLKYFSIVLFKLLNIENDDICRFEKPLLAKIAKGNLKGLRDIRTEVIRKVRILFQGTRYRLIEAVRGVPNNNKIVLVAESEILAKDFMKYFKNNNLYCAHGYHLLDKETNNYPVAASLYKRVIEIPIVLDNERNLLTIKCIEKYLKKCIN